MTALRALFHRAAYAAARLRLAVWRRVLRLAGRREFAALLRAADAFERLQRDRSAR